MLKNLMEDKQLDFNAPLLSVRRYSSSTTSSSGNDYRGVEISLGKKSSLPFYKSELKSGPVRNPGEVPFMWEQTPGRPKDGGGSEIRPLKKPPVAPKLPPGRILDFKQQQYADRKSDSRSVVKPQINKGLSVRQNISHLSYNEDKLKISKEVAEKKMDSDTEDDDNAFTDARDTLSRTESFFYNCSVSGVSGLDAQDVKLQDDFSTNPQILDFMMDRFLPAAKAMASETPHYAPKRPPVRHEEPPQSKMVVNDDMRLVLYQSRSNVVTQSVQDKEAKETESEEEDNYDDHEILSMKACGLLPCFGMKNALNLLSPVPGMNVRRRAPSPSVQKNKTKVKATYSGPHCPKDVVENNWDAVYKHKQMNSLQPVEDERKLTSEFNCITSSSDSQTPDSSSSYKLSSGGGVSPYQTEVSQSPFQELTGFNGFSEPTKAVSLYTHKNPHTNFHDSQNPIEKTLYVDSVNGVGSLKLDLKTLDTKGRVGSGQQDPEILVISRGMEESCLRDINSFTISKINGISQSIYSNLGSSARSTFEENVRRVEGLRKDEDFPLEKRQSLTSKAPTKVNSSFTKEEVSKEDVQRNPCFLAILPLPLPKSPSESWLWRTLPAISSRNDKQFHPRKPSSSSSTDSKWETIVKMSDVKHGLTSISEGTRPAMRHNQAMSPWRSEVPAPQTVHTDGQNFCHWPRTAGVNSST